MKNLQLQVNKLSGTPSLLILPGVVVYESTICFKTSSFALAGSIPTVFGELIKLTELSLGGNKLSGTPCLLILPGVVVRVYHLHNELPKVVVVVVAAVQVVLQVALQVMAQAKICADALSVPYPPGAQVKRRSRYS
jgi:hypothetical protein